MTFDVEVVLKGRDFAVTEAVSTAGAIWNDGAVREVLVEILRAIDRVEHADAATGRAVVLRGFSWIVEPSEGQVVIAIEIPMGAAVAGPFSVDQGELTAMIARVLRAERELSSPTTIH
jgi:hypothetical protein